MESRLSILRKHLQSKNISAAIFFCSWGDANYTYYSGTTVGGVLVVPVKSPAFIISSKMDSERAEAEGKIRRVLVSGGESISQILTKKLGRIKSLGFNPKGMSAEMLANLKKKLSTRYVDIGGFCELQRSVKEPEEILKIRQACAITLRVFQDVIKQKGILTEAALAGQIDLCIRQYGGRPGFETIVASGTNSSMPHYSPGLHKLSGACVLDFGVSWQNYHSDFSRTLVFGKKPEGFDAAYQAVYKAQREIIAHIKPGVKCRELSEMGMKILGKLGVYSIHSFGHGVGLEVHEAPNISLSSTEVLREGMVLAVEPGLYLKGSFGVRIEDTVLVTKEGAEVLTQ